MQTVIVGDFWFRYHGRAEFCMKMQTSNSGKFEESRAPSCSSFELILRNIFKRWKRNENVHIDILMFVLIYTENLCDKDL